MLNDPLSTNNYIRVTGRNEAFDGNGNRYRIERKNDCDFGPFLFTAGLAGIFALLLTGCGLDRPVQPALTQQPDQLEQRSGF